MGLSVSEHAILLNPVCIHRDTVRNNLQVVIVVIGGSGVRPATPIFRRVLWDEEQFGSSRSCVDSQRRRLETGLLRCPLSLENDRESIPILILIMVVRRPWRIQWRSYRPWDWNSHDA